MDKIPDKIIINIKMLIDELNRNKFYIESAILFGSYAKGNYNEFSDIDLALISKDFSGNMFNDKESIRKYVVRVNTDISPIPYRPEDFTSDDLFVREIIESGIWIMC
jgi:uncharacterized protein